MDKKRFIEIKNGESMGIRPTMLVTYLMKDLGLVAVLLVLWNFLEPIAASLLGAPVVAVLMFRNFSFMHDAVHGAVITPRWFNDALGIWSGALCALPFDPWKKVHLQHHHWAGNIDRDPVMLIVNKYPQWPSWLRATLSFFWKAWIPLVACLQYSVFWYTATKHVLKGPPSLNAILSMIVPGAFWVSMFAMAPAAFLWGSVVPGVLLYLLTVEVVNLPHHLELPQYRGDTLLPLWEQHKIARSCLYPKWFAENVVLNFNYHLEHHMYPGLAWYHLHRMHEILKPELGAAYNTDPQFSWILKNRPKDLGEVLRAMEDFEMREQGRQRAA